VAPGGDDDDERVGSDPSPPDVGDVDPDGDVVDARSEAAGVPVNGADP
jgi:hypothetical protein